MACPYFYPDANRRHDLAPASMRMLAAGRPVGRRVPRRPRQPVRNLTKPVLLPLCNLGYARGDCAAFPASRRARTPSASPSRSDDGASLRLYYVVERDHHPFAHGPLEYSHGARSVHRPRPPMKACGRQAQAYVASYLRRKAEAFVR